MKISSLFLIFYNNPMAFLVLFRITLILFETNLREETSGSLE